MNVSDKSGLHAYLTEIKADVSQVENLLGNATATLLAAFTNIANLGRAQERLAAELAASCAAAEGKGSRRRKQRAEEARAAHDGSSLPWLLAQQTVLTGRIESEVDTIVTTLQSQDLTAQLLTHARGCLVALESTLAPARETRAASVAAGSAHDDRAQRETAEIIVFPRSKPVFQHGMGAGDVELF